MTHWSRPIWMGLILILSTQLIPVVSADADHEGNEVSKEDEYSLHSIHPSDGLVTGLSADNSLYICGWDSNGDADDCDSTTPGKLVFHYNVSHLQMGNQIRFKIENTGEPHNVHLDIKLCWKTNDLDPDREMICQEKIENLYDEEIGYITMYSIRSQKYFLMIDADPGTGGDQTMVKVSRQVMGNSNNDRIEPEIISLGQPYNRWVCESDCNNELPDPSDIFVLEVFAGDVIEVNVWSRGCEVWDDKKVDFYWRHDYTIANYTVSRWFDLDDQGCGSDSGDITISTGNTGMTISGIVYFYFIAPGTPNDVDQGKLSYSIQVSVHDTTNRNLSADRDRDGFPDVMESECNTDYTDGNDYPLDFDLDGECDLNDIDDDNDGVNDSEDDCQFSSNLEEGDFDADGCTDSEDDDDDGDGFDDSEDRCQFSDTQDNNFDDDDCTDSEDDDDDNDGWGDSAEIACNASPFDSNEYPSDTDGDGDCNFLDNDDDDDGVTDSSDVFPLNPNEDSDWDGDGIGDNADEDDDNDNSPDDVDSFPYDSTQSSDSDGDGYGDNSNGNQGDQFPNDSTQWDDSDGDGYGDNRDGNYGDQYPNDPTQWKDSDGDGYGDNPAGNNGDQFPDDSTQWKDSDGDGYGDNRNGNDGDQFPDESTQWIDSDGDGYGDNPNGVNPDSCPDDWGTSSNDRNGCLDSDSDDLSDLNDDCPYDLGTSTIDRKGCIDTDGDGVSDPDEDGLAHPNGDADAFRFEPTQWRNQDGDGYGDNPNGQNPDDCPEIYGVSNQDRKGCPDSDYDGWSDSNDVFPEDSSQHADRDNDGYGDNSQGKDADDCPDKFGNSTNQKLGCVDKDGDGWADTDDPCNNDAENQCLWAVISGKAPPMEAQGGTIILLLFILGVVLYVRYGRRIFEPHE